ncbi:MAG TPA: acireductone dioxygenase [Dongiaceae bacterium]|nr:acireductone dioxygenase [Dongiaceae bacterium]
MSTLYIYSEKNAGEPLVETQDQKEIARLLAAEGIRFEQWEAGAKITPESTTDDILDAYADAVDRLMTEGGYKSVDVINMSPSHPDKAALRQKFLDEHRHSEDEVRFFVKGDGIFYLHLNDRVLATQCCAGDLISVPADTRHWFDMGDAPNFTAIRIFTNQEGWVAKFTGDKIASEFPRYEVLAK